MRKLVLSLASTLLCATMCQAGLITYAATLSGANESPVNASTATGSAFVNIDTVAQTMDVLVIFSGLSAPNTASHIHCCTAAPGTGTAGVATITPTFTGFPTGATSGVYSQLFDLTASATYNPSFVTVQGSVANAEAALLAGLAGGRSYLNIHSSNFPGGEIRGFLLPTPEPAANALMLVAVSGLFFARKRLKRN